MDTGNYIEIAFFCIFKFRCKPRFFFGSKFICPLAVDAFDIVPEQEFEVFGNLAFIIYNFPLRGPYNFGKCHVIIRLSKIPILNLHRFL